MPEPFLPNFFLLGAAKSGTTTLYAYLNAMPDICMSSPKEPVFFEAEFNRGLGYYRDRYFPHWAGQRIIGDARTQNLYLPYIAPRIHSVNPNAKLMAILRNPVEQAHSHWHHQRVRGLEPLTFHDALKICLQQEESGRVITEDEARQAAHRELNRVPARPADYRRYLNSGHYLRQIERYTALFPRDHLYIVLFDDLAARPFELVENVVRFVGLDPTTNRPEKELWHNASPPETMGGAGESGGMLSTVRRVMRTMGLDRLVRTRHSRRSGRSARPRIDDRTRVWLAEYYREPNRLLGEFLSRDVSHWV